MRNIMRREPGFTALAVACVLGWLLAVGAALLMG
jgi:hypothetical protein